MRWHSKYYFFGANIKSNRQCRSRYYPNEWYNFVLQIRGFAIYVNAHAIFFLPFSKTRLFSNNYIIIPMRQQFRLSGKEKISFSLMGRVIFEINIHVRTSLASHFALKYFSRGWQSRFIPQQKNSTVSFPQFPLRDIECKVLLESL